MKQPQTMQVPALRIQLDNGHVVQADLQTWLLAVISTLPEAQIQAVCKRCDEVQMQAMTQQLAKSPALAVVKG